MISKSLLAGTALVLALAVPAIAADGPYLASSVGAVLGNDYTHHPVWAKAKANTDKFYAASVAAGYQMDMFRFEIEGGYGRLADATATLTAAQKAQYPNLDTEGDLTMWTALAGAYIDLPVTRTYQPYLGLGGGIVDLSSGTALIRVDEGMHPAAFGEVGLNMALWKNLTVAPGYRYLWVNAKNGSTDNVSTHIVKLSARARF